MYGIATLSGPDLWSVYDEHMSDALELEGTCACGGSESGS